MCISLLYDGSDDLEWAMMDQRVQVGVSVGVGLALAGSITVLVLGVLGLNQIGPVAHSDVGSMVMALGGGGGTLLTSMDAWNISAMSFTDSDRDKIEFGAVSCIVSAVVVTVVVMFILGALGWGHIGPFADNKCLSVLSTVICGMAILTMASYACGS